MVTHIFQLWSLAIFRVLLFSSYHQQRLIKSREGISRNKETLTPRFQEEKKLQFQVSSRDVIYCNKWDRSLSLTLRGV